jgi:hypothetical protein
MRHVHQLRHGPVIIQGDKLGSPQFTPVISTGELQYGYRIRKSLSHPGKLVFTTGASLYEADTVSAAKGSSRETIGNAHSHPLCPRLDWSDAFGSYGIDDRVVGKTGNEVNPLSFKNPGDSLLTIHDRITSSLNSRKSVS